MKGETELVELRKYSTMGNATTFPVQSFIFLACALTGTLVQRGVTTRCDLEDQVKRLTEEVSVYGDDMIVPVDSVGLVIRLLTLLDFKVNTDKSFTHGCFRESCGVDAFRGVEVTPVYVSSIFDDTPESYASTIETSNNLYRKFLVKTSNFVRYTAGRIKFPLVPVDSGVVGYQSFVDPGTDGLLSRHNRALQDEEIRVPGFTTKNPRTPFHNDTALLQFFTEEPDPSLPWTGGQSSRPVLKIKHRWVSSTQFPTQGKQTDVAATPTGDGVDTRQLPRRAGALEGYTRMVEPGLPIAKWDYPELARRARTESLVAAVELV